MNVYDEKFYSDIKAGSIRSAAVILPLVATLAPLGSCVDVGCGTAGWLRVALDCGATRVTGIDGDHVDRSALQIDAREFVAHELEAPLPPLGRFDLVICLEVAEHLSIERAESFVADLCGLGDVVLFSAAVPGQGGSQHVNERWQSYWVSQFEANGYRVFDSIRPWIWNDERVEFWYRQNVFVAVNMNRCDLVELALARKVMAPVRWDTPTPEMLRQEMARTRRAPGIAQAVKDLAKAVTRPARRQLSRWRRSHGEQAARRLTRQ